MRPTKGKFKKRMRYAWMYGTGTVVLKRVARHTEVRHMTMRSKLQLIKQVKLETAYSFVSSDLHINEMARKNLKNTLHYLAQSGGIPHNMPGDIH